jgi:phage tail-like protein
MSETAPPTPESKRNIYRYDPYKNYRFRIKWDNHYVAGMSKVSALIHTAPVVTHREGGDARVPPRAPGQSEYNAITMERGVTHDAAFEQWANNSVYQTASSRDCRKDIVLELYNEAGQKLIAYNIYRCWVSEFQAMPELDGMGNATAIQMLRLENEGWARDASVTDPAAPDFSLPAS